MEYKSGIVHFPMGRAKVNEFPNNQLVLRKTAADDLSMNLLEMIECGAVSE